MNDPSITEHLCWMLLYGDWEYGYATKQKWPGKRRLALCCTYYDGWNAALHVGGFYICVSY